MTEKFWEHTLEEEANIEFSNALRDHLIQIARSAFEVGMPEHAILAIFLDVGLIPLRPALTPGELANLLRAHAAFVEAPHPWNSDAVKAAQAGQRRQ